MVKCNCLNYREMLNLGGGRFLPARRRPSRARAAGIYPQTSPYSCLEGGHHVGRDYTSTATTPSTPAALP